MLVMLLVQFLLVHAFMHICCLSLPAVADPRFRGHGCTEGSNTDIDVKSFKVLSEIKTLSYLLGLLGLPLPSGVGFGGVVVASGGGGAMMAEKEEVKKVEEIEESEDEDFNLYLFA
ncbi:hypothetical protein P3S68_032681 [Capsicum galapagoense]